MTRTTLRRRLLRRGTAVTVAAGLAATLSAGSAGASISAPAPRAVPICTVGDLRILVDLQGAAGSLVGSVRFTNFSDHTCTLQGRPRIKFIDSAGPAPLNVVKTQPWWKVNGMPQPPGWPVTKLHPGDQAVTRTRWSNWCRSDPNPIWKVAVPGSNQRIRTGWDGSPPPCNDPSSNTMLEIGPFEPGADAS
jgi:hypothetical protein